MLSTIDFGPDRPTKPPLVIAHGLFGSARNWGVIAKRLSSDRRVICVDMRNHGASPWSASMTYPDMAQDLIEVVAPLGQADLLGHSMGGKAAMLAVLMGAPVGRLIVGDIAPVTYGHTQMHLIDAMDALDLGPLLTRADSDAALAQSVEDPGIRAFLLQSIDLKEKRWRLNLAALRAHMGDILSFPDTDVQTDTPTLFLTGAASDYVTPSARPAIRRHFPKARFAKLMGAGHWLHADKPREFEASVRAFLDA
ncbi:MAG: alpha/beta fold hydrolase [Pseudomonadota bacterium]